MELDRRQWLAQGGAIAALSLAGPVSADAVAPGRTRLILLGTGGGPTPKKNRSAPALAIVVDGVTYVVDCGDGVARQLVSAGLKLSSINSVFLTHHHSDHNADYGNLLLLAWAADLAHRVDTYGPPPLRAMTRQALALNAVDIRTRIGDEGRPPLAPLIHPHEISRPGPVMQDSRVRVRAALVRHPPVEPAFAYRFDTPDRSIVISGDTAPSEALVDLARGADVLVHEVMYLPALEALLATEPNAARLKEHLLASHTTTEQVGNIATQAGVKTLVLSHFVPGGYPFIEDQVWLEAVRPHFSGKIVVGRDLLEL
ncbi:MULTISPECIES: MBL fold metallo-hydrolase [unclassified Caulobacter]|uniref:MBL fold metallo-hydrolase n=1 Tax=unclassified Caulobacter TaxID=2648921 RepID=UPI000D3A0A0C|nr:MULTISPECIES: MBL fold metallo-hydrolase [unclassified Caulobacter]PTS89411.1 MBL fold metallo-hydrolase [Caulobacter sp. HMWF009]PTT04467.1 MBL fold metallo-hydrolase [Caulobacter sp. HMWF025]